MDVGGLEGPRIVFGGGLVRQFRRAVDEPADDEFVEMLVAPAEGGLQHVVQFRQVQRRRQQQASPDRRLDVLQRDLGLDDRLVDRSHIAIMAATRLWRQLRAAGDNYPAICSAAARAVRLR